MKRLVLIAIAWLMCMLSYAQAYEVDFSVDKEKTTATYKLKNNTRFNMFLVYGHFSSLKSYCRVYYTLSDGEDSFIDLDVRENDRKPGIIKPGETYFYQIDILPYKKRYQVTKLEGAFQLLYRESANDDLVPVRIKKVITL